MVRHRGHLGGFGDLQKLNFACEWYETYLLTVCTLFLLDLQVFQQ